MSALLVLSLKGAAAAALVGLALALAERLRIRVPAFLRHALWLVVFVRLLVPVLPAIHGALRPRILLPRNAARTLGPEALRHALLHELAHVRRWDGATRLLARLATAVHWFNPAAWYALGRLEAECELACDAAVLQRLGDGERAGYGRTLLHAATLTTGCSIDPDGGMDRRETLKGAVTALPLSTHDTLKRRIQMIARYRSPSRQHLAALCLAAAALSFVALTDAPLSAAPSPAPDQAPGNDASVEDLQSSKETIAALRNGGTAMFAWITDAVMDSGTATQEDAMAAQNGEGDPGEDEGDEPSDPQALSWHDCPPISYDELRELLVPTYIAVTYLPRTDGWGHALEFCLDRSPADREMLIAGIRSPGKDGVFDGSVYTPGPFAVSDFDRDVVWIDGYFVRWPSAEVED